MKYFRCSGNLGRERKRRIIDISSVNATPNSYYEKVCSCKVPQRQPLVRILSIVKLHGGREVRLPGLGGSLPLHIIQPAQFAITPRGTPGPVITL